MAEEVQSTLSDESQFQSVEPDPSTQQSVPAPININDFKVNAFEILNNAPDYNTGISQLTDSYSKLSDQTAGRDTLSDYGNALRFKFEQPRPNPQTLIDMMPVKPSQVEGDTPLEKINNYEQANIDAIKASKDPDYIAAGPMLISSLQNDTSAMRRDVLSGDSNTPTGWVTDKFFRFSEGLVGPFAQLAGYPEADRYLQERTAPESDKGITGKLASFVGGAVPLVAAGLTGQAELAVPAVIGAQAAGSAREVYNASIENTGNPNRAAVGAALTFGAQAITQEAFGHLTGPLIDSITGKLATGALKEAAAVDAAALAKNAIAPSEAGTLLDPIIKSLQSLKSSPGNVALSTIAAGTSAGAAQILGNMANNIALNRDGDITDDVYQTFIAGSILGGVLSGGKALMDNSIIDQHINLLSEMKDKLSGKTAPVEEKPTGVTADISPYVTGPDGRQIKVRDSLSDYTVNQEGYVEEAPKPPPDVATRHEAGFRVNKMAEDWVNSKPIDWEKHITTESGEQVNIPASPDEVVDHVPPGTVILQEGSEPSTNYADTVYPYQKELSRSGPSRAITYFASKMGAAFQLDRNIMDGAFGSYNPGTGKVRILRSLGADETKFKSTLAHEVGHFIDHTLTQLFSKDSELGKSMEGFIGLADLIKRSAPDKGEMIDTFKDAREISARWRPGWDGSPGKSGPGSSVEDRFNAYRSMPEEIYADVTSAILNAPDLVRNDYPRVWANFEGQLSAHPELNQFWNQLRSFDDNPGAISAFNMQVAKEGRVKQGVIQAAAKQRDIQNNSLANRLKRAALLDFTTIFQRWGLERAKANDLTGEARNEAMKNVDLVERKDYLGQYLQTNFGTPLDIWLKKFRQTEIDANIAAHYMWATNVANQTTRTIKNIHENYDLYLAAAKGIDFGLSQMDYTDANKRGIKPGIRKEIFNFDNIKTPDDLSDAFAKMGIIGDTAKMLHVSDFFGGLDPNDPKALSIANGRYNRAVANLNRRKESLPIADLKAQIEKLPNSPIKKAMQDVTQDGAFAVRKYLMNAGGQTIYDAKRDIAHIQDSLGEEKFNVLQNFTKSYHDILNTGNKVIKESGIFSPELLDRIGLNQDYYVMSNVLRHFEGDDTISASLRQAVGSLSETGNEISSTASKMQKINARAFLQRSVNAAVELAKLNGHVVDEVPREYNRNIFDMRNTLSKNDREHSYLISYKEGEPTLNKISGGKVYERMFQTIRDLPGISTLLELSDAINKTFLTRQLKTSLSPLFVLFNKFYDRQKEMLFANSLAVAFPGIGHLDLKLRGEDRVTRNAINHYLETRKATGTGELTGPLKTIVENDAALFLLHEAGQLGTNSGTTFADGIYELFGAKQPDERGTLEKIGNFTEKALGKVGGDWLKSITDFDHLRTKVNGYQIGKRVFGMSDEAATVFAREKFGVPDTMGGGTAAPLINRMFLFGRAHLNEVRTLGSFLKDNPKIAATQIARRLVMPKMLMMGAVMQPVMRLAFGDEDANKYVAMLNMIPEFEKISKTVIPLGFQDSSGSFHNFFDVRFADIKPDWKAWYIRLPQSREITTLNKIAWPFVKNAIEGKVEKAIGGAALGAGSDFAASIQPSIQYLTNLAQITTGYNPTDFYRMKGIFRNDVQEGGSFVQKLGEYGKYAFSQQYPLAGLYRPFNPDTPKSPLEEIQATPFVGPLARGLTGVSNYGLIEQSKEGQAARVAEDAQIKFTTSEDTQHVLDLVSRVRGQVQSAGGAKKGELSNELRKESTDLNYWHSNIYLPYREELRQARDAGDTERYNYLLKQLNQSASSILKRIEPDISK